MPSAKPAPGNSFADKHPELLDEWDYETNAAHGNTPENVTHRSSRKIHWICRKCGHRWVTTPNYRSTGGGCKHCGAARRGRAKQRPPAGKSLADVAPGIARHWHPTLNGETTAQDVYPASEIPRYWLCDLGHVERTPPKLRRRQSGGNGCVTCGGRRVEEGVNDLQTTHPDTAAQWDELKNSALGLGPTQVSAGSERRAWWRCPNGHSWQAIIKSRAHGKRGCPACIAWATSQVEVQVRCELAAVGVPVVVKDRWRVGKHRMQLDIVVPDWSLVIEYDGYRWHKAQDNRERDLLKSRRLEAAGWTVVRVRDRLEPLGVNDVRVCEADGVLPTVKALLRRLGELGMHTDQFGDYLRGDSLWAAQQAVREYQRVLSKSLASERPELARQLDPDLNNGVSAKTIHPGTNARYWWRCPACQHQWPAAVSARVGSSARPGTGCPQCGRAARGKKRSLAVPGQSLADHFPDLAREWDAEKNAAIEGLYSDQVKPFSVKKAWWICPAHQHSYRASIASRTNVGTGCPYCTNRRVLAGFNDLATTHPDLARDWNLEANRAEFGVDATGVTAGSNTRAHWRCHACGRRWQARIYSRMQGRSRCKCVQSPR